MKQVELVIFDMDGLMFDSEKISFRAWKEAVVKFGYPFEFEFFLTLVGSNAARIKDLCLIHYGNDFPFDLIKEEKLKVNHQIVLSEGVPLKKGLVELLTFLKDKKIKTAVATSSERDRAEHFLKLGGITDYFDSIISGDEVTHSKPDPEIFLKSAMKFNCNPQHTIVLEDSEAGITAAYEANMMPFMVPDLKQPSVEIKRKVFKCFDSLIDVKDYLLNNI